MHRSCRRAFYRIPTSELVPSWGRTSDLLCPAEAEVEVGRQVGQTRVQVATHELLRLLLAGRLAGRHGSAGLAEHRGCLTSSRRLQDIAEETGANA